MSLDQEPSIVKEMFKMQVLVGKVAGGSGAAIAATSYTTGTGALFLIVLVTVLLTLLAALTRFVPRKER